MKILEIKTYPARILRSKCEPVLNITSQEQILLENMLITMKQAQGIGLAAPQVGSKKSLIVVDIGQGPLKLINPEILRIKGKDTMEEGCLSVPNAVVKIVRPYEIIVKGLNEQGRAVELVAKGLLARVILHELDHLNGKLIIDYLHFFKKIKHQLSANFRAQG